MVVYVGMLAAGSAAGPIVAGAVAQTLGNWRWYERILSFAILINLLGSIVMLPETTHPALDLTGTTPMVVQDELGGKTEEDRTEFASAADPMETNSKMSLWPEYLERSFSVRYAEMNWTASVASFFEVFKLLIVPQAVVTSLVFGITIGWTVLASILVSMVYAQPPLLWDSLHVGLLNVAPLAGLLVGVPLGGVVADMLYKRALKRDCGDAIAASRLPAVSIGGLISPAGCILLGYGLQHPEEWIMTSLGWAMLSFGLTGSANILLTYAVDCLPAQAGDIGTLVNIVKNCIGFGISYASLSWMVAMGPVKQFAIMASILFASYLLVIPLWLFHSTITRRSSSL